MFDLVNDGDNILRAVSGPWSFFRRVRLLVGSQIVEDIDYYNRVHEMMEILTASDSRANEDVEGFGNRWDLHEPISYYSDISGIEPYNFAPGGNRQTVLFKPLCGLFNQNKFLPLTYMQSITLEMELIDNQLDPIVSNISPFSSENNSTSWHIENVQAKCDVVSLDTGLQNSYDEIVLSSKEIPIHYNTFSSQFQTISGQDEPFVNVSRAATRLKSVFISFDKNFTNDERISPIRKSWNDFYSPASISQYIKYIPNARHEFELQLQIGNKLFPEYPIRSHAEAYYQLRKTLGVQSSKVHSFDITPRQYRDNRLIIGIDTEKTLGASFTGLNTRSGDLMTVKFKYKNKIDSGGRDRSADRIHILLHTDNILQINASGCSVFD